MAEKLDLSKADPAYYSAKPQPAIIPFGPLAYLTLAGRGDPNGLEFAQKTEALYQLAYGIKGVCKAQGDDFVVPKLEGLWWVEDDHDALDVPRSEWLWQLLIRMPGFVTGAMFAAARAQTATKKHNPLVHEITFEQLDEGLCAQILHIGPYATEPETIARLLNFIRAQNKTVVGRHHEIYLSDPRKAAPETMKTIIRYPVR